MHAFFLEKIHWVCVMNELEANVVWIYNHLSLIHVYVGMHTHAQLLACFNIIFPLFLYCSLF